MTDEEYVQSNLSQFNLIHDLRQVFDLDHVRMLFAERGHAKNQRKNVSPTFTK